MDAFHALSLGGAKFNKKRFQSQVQLFSGKAGESSSSRPLKRTKDDAELPPELDFFKYDKGGKQTRADSDKEESSDNESDDEARATKKRKLNDDKDAAPTPASHRVTTKGQDVPQSLVSFAALKDRFDVSSRLLQNLADCGYKTPTGVQEYGIPILLAGRDLAAISPTGTGKTLAYTLPIFASLKSPASRSQDIAAAGVRAVILAPTRELAGQIYNECLKLAQGRKWRIVLFSKATATTLADKDVRDKIDIIISTPLRLVACLKSETLELDNVRHLVLDEADRLLDTEFLEQVQEIFAACSHKELRTAVFSATLPAGVEEMAMQMMRNPIRIVVGLKDTPLPLIAQSLVYVSSESSKLLTLLQHLGQPYVPPLLVFVSTQPRAGSLAEELVLHDVPNVDCLHAGMSKKEREDAVTRMRNGESWVMITTEVMARGMDFKGVRGVINYDFPQSVQSYIHRIGRTGRAGQTGTAITYFTDADAPYLKSIANVLLQSGSPVPEWIMKLPKPSKMKRRMMGKVKRGDDVSPAARITKGDTKKRRDMIAGSKRRKAREGEAVDADVGEASS
ncbi:P-loop containing nucleoside triphosphate hydrolase protein [Exidia glandulosa HHB12029]|uniref:RNA helicase n=1 Tax=Exidia glandulosa HHB12029 TaxID=1314781 RepID=A0A165K0M8_EXIGL|nr:P-loop containing nucleoside triphosphate hydrolase protein [Exidia glandulosa HHB12029]